MKKTCLKKSGLSLTDRFFLREICVYFKGGEIKVNKCLSLNILKGVQKIIHLSRSIKNDNSDLHYLSNNSNGPGHWHALFYWSNAI